MTPPVIDDYDRLLSRLGGFGRFQKTRFYFFCLPAVFVFCSGMFTNIFILFTPDHHCMYPPGIPTDWDNGTAINATLLASIFRPADKMAGGLSKCTLKTRYANQSYDIDGDEKLTQFLREQMNLATVEEILENDSQYEQSSTNSHVLRKKRHEVESSHEISAISEGVFCPYGIWYDRSDWAENLVTRFDLVCGRAQYVSTIYSVANGGFIVGMILLATLQDQIGRKKTFFIAVGWDVLIGKLSAMKDVRGSTGRRRTLGLPKMQQNGTRTDPTSESKPSVNLTLSPQPEAQFDQIDASFLNSAPAKDVVKYYGFWSLFSSLNLFAKTMILSLGITANLIVYSGFNINIEHLGYNQYILFAVTSLTEIPAALGLYFAKYVGKLTPTAVGMILAGVFSIISGQIPPTAGWIWALLFFTTLMKLCITCSFDLIYLVAGEIFPTVVRASGMGVVFAIAALVNIGTPFIIFAAIEVHASLPMTIFGIIAFLTGLICLFLPEASGNILLDTLEQADEYRVGLRSFLRNISWSYARNRKLNAGKERSGEGGEMWISVPTQDG